MAGAGVWEGREQGEAPLERIKEEMDLAEMGEAAVTQYQGFQNSGSWDSGIVVDSSTVVQMAEFQEVVDRLSRQAGPPPPPYPGPGVVVTEPSSPTISSDMMDILRGRSTLPHTYQGVRERVVEGGVAPPHSLPCGQAVHEIQNSHKHTRPPSFKQSTPTCRTNMRQLLWREQCMERERRREEGVQVLPTATLDIPANISSPRLSPEIPNEVFKIECRLENPTVYHVLESQRRQVAEYLSEGDSSLPGVERRTSLGVSPATTSTSAPPPSTGRRVSAPFSPGTYSSTGTSPAPSEVCDDFLDELLAQEAGGEGKVPDIRLVDPTTTSMLDFGIKEEPLGEDDLRVFTKDRVKKDNHNQIERRRRFNINDRIKELGTLLPTQHEPYYDIVRDVRQNKGSILKASVDYIKLLRRDKEKRSALEERCRKLEQSHRMALIKLQEYERRLEAAGQPVEHASWRAATRGELSTLATTSPCPSVLLEGEDLATSSCSPSPMSSPEVMES